jgi:hypothetical protein
VPPPPASGGLRIGHHNRTLHAEFEGGVVGRSDCPDMVKWFGQIAEPRARAGDGVRQVSSV